MVRTNVTIQDVADRAGVSKTTAASILRNARGLRASNATRQRVLEVSERLGYRRNAIAASLSLGRTQVIGALLPLYNITSPCLLTHVYAQDLFVAIFKAAYSAGLRVIPCALPDLSDVSAAVHAVTDRHIDGLVLAAFYDAAFLRGVEAAGIPCVEIGSVTGGYHVQPDNMGGGEAAVAYLASLGHRRIAHWHGGGRGHAAYERHAGFDAAAKRLGIETMLVWDEATTAEALRLPPESRPTALFAFNDHNAFRTLGIARSLGLRVPEDLSLIGFDDSVLAQTAYPMLTTIHNPLDEQAEKAIMLLKARLQGEEPAESHLVAPTHLIVRDSTAPAPGAGKIASLRPAEHDTRKVNR